MKTVAAFAILLLTGGCAMADDLLFDFAKVTDPATIRASDVKVSLVPFGDGRGLQLATGHRQDWPGITLPAPDGKWDLSRRAWLAIDIKNTGTAAATFCCRVDNPGADGIRNCVTGQTPVAPGATVTLKVTLRHRPVAPPPVKLFGMRGYPYGSGDQGSIDTRNVTQLVLFVPKPSSDHQLQIGNLRAGGEHTPEAPWPAGKPFLPLIDTFGQYRHRDWPGKVHSEAELKQRVADEAKELAARPGPDDWDQWGGWQSGPQLKATGFFRTEKHQGKWWLVDPDGHLFFSHGIDCVRMMDATPVTERDGWFEDFPGDRPEYKEFVIGAAYALHGHYAGKRPRCFSFAGSNLKRKYGAEWRQAAADIAHRRLRSWGLNTIANWSDATVYQLRRTPYTATVGFQSKMLEGSQGYWGKFRDVFDPSFAAGIERAAKGLKGGSAGDPWCLGYFVDNEIAWGDDTSLAVAALQSPAGQAAKQVFVADLKAKYATIDKLNAAWGTQHASWDALAESTKAPDRLKAREDLIAFYTKSAETYFRVIRDALRVTAPNQLYLGCRFAWVNPLAAAAGAKYCDVVSYNLYQRSVADFKLPFAADVPLIIGEYHFGALDRGMFHTGLVPVDSQAERAAAYQNYVRGALQHPQFVGCHWFQYQDEPTTGRVLDEENYQIGFVDIADTPYRETVDACREVGYAMYRTRLDGK